MAVQSQGRDGFGSGAVVCRLLSHSFHFHHHQRVANERWKPSWSELRHVVSVKYTLDFKDLVQKKRI